MQWTIKLACEKADIFYKPSPYKMNVNKPYIYFITNDLNNKKEDNELLFLQKVGHLVIITDRPGIRHPLGIRTISTKPQSKLTKIALHLWLKLCFLFGKLGNSNMDKRFPERNVYMNVGIARYMVNIVWSLKNVVWINWLLPRYDTLYFMPFWLLGWKKLRSRARMKRSVKRIFVHDALLVRMNAFAGVIAQARAASSKTLANIKSWDNPFYSQLSTGADGFLVWSPSMWSDVIRTHGSCESKFVYEWGARPFFEMVSAKDGAKTANGTKTHISSRVLTSSNRQVAVGYAAAFGDEYLGRHEVNLLKILAFEIEKQLPHCKLKIRPYPTLGSDFYTDLSILSNVEIVSIEGAPLDRFGDGRELIRFGSPNERLDYLFSCDVFLSLATSFTIEAAICNLPIVHLQLATNERRTESERQIFQRIDICDHLSEYFVRNLVCANSYTEAARYLKAAIDTPEPSRERSTVLLRKMGVPGCKDRKHLPATSFLTDLKKWMVT